MIAGSITPAAESFVVKTDRPLRIFVALSGGVDSSVVAHLLKSQGHQVVAGFMVTYREDSPRCTTRDDLIMAQTMADFLGIPLHIVDYREEYNQRIISLLVEGYRQGLTPNPDVWCNNLIKFDLFAQDAHDHGFDAMATGHYAQIMTHDDGSIGIYAGLDSTKDQSYFLSRLTPEQCAYSLLPLGSWTKDTVRQYASDHGFPNADRHDSQGLCFIGNVGIKDFLQQYLPTKTGKIIADSGDVLGEHDGAWWWTRGQRRGLGMPAGWYVYQTDVETNTVFVCAKDSPLLATRVIGGTQWHRFVDPASLGDVSLVCKARYRQEWQPCTYADESVTLSSLQRGLAPGQIVVLADEQTHRLYGSAIISSLSSS